jgi:hypothetical protein
MEVDLVVDIFDIPNIVDEFPELLHNQKYN